MHKSGCKIQTRFPLFFFHILKVSRILHCYKPASALFCALHHPLQRRMLLQARAFSGYAQKLVNFGSCITTRFITHRTNFQPFTAVFLEPFNDSPTGHYISCLGCMIDTRCEVVIGALQLVLNYTDCTL